MTQTENNPTTLPFLTKLCAHLSDEDMRAAEDRFWGYVDIVRRIHERVETEQVNLSGRFDKAEE